MRTINLDNTEITNRLYDTLFKNKQWPQMNLDDMVEQFVDAPKGYIEFVYMNHKVKIKVMSELI